MSSSDTASLSVQAPSISLQQGANDGQDDGSVESTSTTEAIKDARKLKVEGNTAFHAGEFESSIQLYSQALTTLRRSSHADDAPTAQLPKPQSPTDSQPLQLPPIKNSSSSPADVDMVGGSSGARAATASTGAASAAAATSAAAQRQEEEAVLLSNRSAAYASLAKRWLNRPAARSEAAALYGPDPRRLAELALMDAQKVVSLKPGWPKAHSRLGQALVLCERYRDAEAAYVAGLRIDPGSQALKDGLREVRKLLGLDTDEDDTGARTPSPAPSAGPSASPSVSPQPPSTQPPSDRMAAPKRQRSNGARAVRPAQDDCECSLCLKLMYEPVTTPCGHSFCRTCLVRAVDHAPRCPVCRCAMLHVQPDIPISITLASIIQKAFPQEYAERAEEEAAARAEAATPGSSGGTFPLALFVMSTVMPGERMTLNIFEPRYRLLVRRAMEGNKRFGMAQMKQSDRTLEEVAVEVEILECQAQPDGRYYLEVVGRRRVEMVEMGEMDGYRTARCRAISDTSPAPGTPEAAQLPGLVTNVVSRVDTLVARVRTWANSPGAGMQGRRIRSQIECAGPKPPETAFEALSFWAGYLVTSFSPSLDYEDRTRLLVMRDTRERLQLLSRALDDSTSGNGCALM